jgi:hypothetical protein
MPTALHNKAGSLKPVPKTRRAKKNAARVKGAADQIQSWKALLARFEQKIKEYDRRLAELGAQMRLLKSQPIDARAMPAGSEKPGAASSSASDSQLIDRLLSGFQLTQAQLATQILHCAQRSLTLWKAGQTPNPGAALRLRELDRLYQALAELMAPEDIGPWMRRTNEYLQPLTPLEVLARGETDRLWHIIHNVSSGMPT